MMRSESAEDVMEQDQPSMLLDRVPAHVLREVFGFLGDSDLARAEATCATFRQASRSESLWRDKLADKLGKQKNITIDYNVIKGCDHFFRNHLDPMEKHVENYLNENL